MTKMKNKLFLCLLAITAVLLIPLTSVSKEKGEKSINLTSSNLLVLNSEVTGDSVSQVITQAKKLDEKLSASEHFGSKAPLYLFLNTPGGDIQAGLELIESLKGLGRPIHTITLFAASMGFQIAQNLDTRYILDKGQLMSHRAAGQFTGSFGGASPSQLDQRYHLWLQITKELDETTVARTKGKQTLDSYQKAYSNELWMTGHESVEGGYADEITRVRCDKSVTGTSSHTAEFLGLKIVYELDKCPLNTSPTNIHMSMGPGITDEYVRHVKDQFLSSFEQRATTPVVVYQNLYGVYY